LILLRALFPAIAQETTGIQFIQHLNWTQILAKAKADHKYIFVDCYASWCGPCKQMDQNIYPLKEVGEAYNKDFICVKSQMDRTSGDNEEVKNWYNTATSLNNIYSVSSYPTFIFFDPSGKAVHKVSGSLNSSEFIQLAKDARNFERQYYTVAKNFLPGKLDTAEEKALTKAFQYSDKELAGKMAADYLSRIPKEELNNYDNGLLMIQLQDNPVVLNIAVTYINNHEKYKNLNFIALLSNKQEVKKIAFTYIKGLNQNDFLKTGNLKFIQKFATTPEVKLIIQNQINNLPEDSLYSIKMLNFLSETIESPSDRGFSVFYRDSNRVNKIMKSKDFAQNNAAFVINKVEFEPFLDTAKKNGVPPDFNIITKVITQKYNADYAKRIEINGKVEWYKFLAVNKKQGQYWSLFISCKIDQVTNYFNFEKDADAINNIVYYDIFVHSDDVNHLNIAINWMKNLIEKNPKKFEYIDTYADVLYKAGNLKEALLWKELARQTAESLRNKKNVDFAAIGIEKMKNGEQIWTEPEYIGN